MRILKIIFGGFVALAGLLVTVVFAPHLTIYWLIGTMLSIPALYIYMGRNAIKAAAISIYTHRDNLPLYFWEIVKYPFYLLLTVIGLILVIVFWKIIGFVFLCVGTYFWVQTLMQYFNDIHKIANRKKS